MTGVQFQVDGTNLGSSVTIGPVYTLSWDTTKYANGLHTLAAIATDSAGNAGTASVSVSINNVVATPVISGVSAASITASSASIVWTTDTASDSQVAYGVTAAYGLTSSLGATLVAAHVVALSGLSPSTTYHCQVLSRNGQGNLASSADFTFTTAASSSGAGWQDLTNTKLKSVCPADSFGGINYAFADYCGAVITAWSGAAADTKRNRLIIWGGGHVDYSGNEVYSLNLGSAPPTMTRLTDPSDFTKTRDVRTRMWWTVRPFPGTPMAASCTCRCRTRCFLLAEPRPLAGGPFSGRTYALNLSRQLRPGVRWIPLMGTTRQLLTGKAVRSAAMIQTP